MAAVVAQLVTGPITNHAFSKDRRTLSICPNSNELQIFAKSTTESSGWSPSHLLTEHDKLITSIDWAPNTNRIVTCSQDRNAYVWTFDASNSTWKPILVLLRINRAATCVKWSPKEDKFAVASGARTISICHYEQENDWWISKHIKKPIRSTVLSVDWHPNNVILASGSADMKARVFSAYIKDIDEKPPASAWGSKLPLNTLCREWSNNGGGWVHGVAFSPSGNALAWVSHDSSITVAHPAQDPAQDVVQRINTQHLPFVALLWTSEMCIVTAGHDCTPMLFSKDDGQSSWQFKSKLDQQNTQKKVVSGTMALNRFKQMDSRAQSSPADDQLQTTHQNTITHITAYERSGSQVTKVSTSGVDGKVVIWNLQSLEGSMNNLRV